MVWRDKRGVGQENLLNTDKILLFKCTPFIRTSLQAPFSLQSFLAMPAPVYGKLLFKHNTFSPRVSPCCCAAFPELLPSSFFLPSFSLACIPDPLHAAIFFYLSKWVGSGLYMPHVPTPPSIL